MMNRTPKFDDLFCTVCGDLMRPSKRYECTTSGGNMNKTILEKIASMLVKQDTLSLTDVMKQMNVKVNDTILLSIMRTAFFQQQTPKNQNQIRKHIFKLLSPEEKEKAKMLSQKKPSPLNMKMHYRECARCYNIQPLPKNSRLLQIRNKKSKQTTTHDRYPVGIFANQILKRTDDNICSNGKSCGKFDKETMAYLKREFSDMCIGSCIMYPKANHQIIKICTYCDAKEYVERIKKVKLQQCT